MCPLRGDQKVLVMDEGTGEFRVSPIEDLYKALKVGKTYTILHNGKMKKAALRKFERLNFYRVHTSNGQTVVLSEQHQNLTLGGKIKKTEELTTDDYLPFSITPFEGDDRLSYEDGLLVGAFIGGGKKHGTWRRQRINSARR